MAQENRFIDGTNIDTSVFSYSAPKAHASGGKVVNLYNKNFKQSLSIATPLLLTWGAQEGKDQQGNATGKWSLSLQFPSSEYPNADGEAFLKSMRKLEAQIKSDAMLYSKEWFGKTINSPEVMDEKFNVMLRHPKIKGSLEPDLSKAPTMTVKVPCWAGVWKTNIYDEDGEPLYINGKVNSHLTPLEYLNPKTHVVCGIECGGLWFVNGKVAITWNLKQAIVQKSTSGMEGKCLLVLKPADKEKMKTLPEPEEAIEQVSTVVEDSDEEEEDDEYEAAVPVPVVEPVPTPPPAPVAPVSEEKAKKRVVKKKTDA